MMQPPLPFSTLGPPLDPAAIARFEERWKCRIPEPYKAFLLRSNGGELALPMFETRRPNGRVREESFEALLAIDHENEMRDLGWFYSMYVDWQRRIPEDLFPIGTDDGGNLILMGGEGPRFGRIYYWQHDWESSTGEPPTERNVYFIANSLDEFLASLKPFLTTVK